jgi:RecB family endonuclease NucS
MAYSAFSKGNYMSVSEETRSQIIEMLGQGISSQAIAEKLGTGVQVVAGYKAALTKARIREEEVVVESVEAKIGLERDLQFALRQNLEQLEHGLKATDGGEERIVISGKIDITAEDRSGDAVVIELKVGTADRKTVGQITGYMGDLQLESSKPVRGIVVAADFDTAVISALRVLPNVQLKKYQVKFSFESIAPKN